MPLRLSISLKSLYDSDCRKRERWRRRNYGGIDATSRGAASARSYGRDDQNFRGIACRRGAGRVVRAGHRWMKEDQNPNRPTRRSNASAEDRCALR